jgi:hypothetical protein
MPEPLYYDAESTEALKRGVWKVLGALPIYIIVPMGLYLLRAQCEVVTFFQMTKCGAR